MREAKSIELREAAKIMAQQHSSQIDRKNALLESLQNDLDDHERQHRFAVAQHVRQVEALLQLHATRQRETSNWFATDARSIAESFANEQQEITQHHQRQKRDMLDVLDSMEKAHENAWTHQRATFETQREEIKSKNAEEFENTRVKLEKTVLQCEKVCEDAHRAYISGTDTRSASFERLAVLDSASAKLIESRMRELGKLARKVRAMKGKLKASAMGWKSKNKSLRKEKELIRNHSYALSNETKQFRKDQDVKLKLLLNGSNEALRKLDLKLVEAERILKLAAAARRLETERERVAPFGESSDDSLWANSLEMEHEMLQASGMIIVTPSTSTLTAHMEELSEEDQLSSGAVDLTTGENIGETNYLDRFFKRFNKVFLDERAARNETQRLTEENSDLKQILTDYLNGVSVNQEVLADQNNPLFVVNDRVLKSQRERRETEEKNAQEKSERKLFNSRRGLGVTGSRTGSRQKEQVTSQPVEVFVKAN